MNYVRKSLLGLGVLLLASAVLLWFLPARWLMPWVEPQLHGWRLQQVQGSLWQGRAAEVVSPGGEMVGELQWRVSRLALLGRLLSRVSFNGPQLQFSTTVERLPGDRIVLSDANLHGELSALGHDFTSPWGQPRGEMQVAAPQAELQGGWPLRLEARVHWKRAVMRTPHGDVALGELQMQAQAQGGVIQAQVHDDGNGPLHVDGQIQLSPLGWRLDATLRPRQTDPSLHRWLASLGPASADGGVAIHRSGGLATPARTLE